MRLRCLLTDIMRARGMRVSQLSELSGVCKSALSALRTDESQRFDRDVIERVCTALDVGPGELFELVREDIWAPIRVSKEVTIHYGSRSFPDNLTPNGDDFIWPRQYIGVWDERTIDLIRDHLRRLSPDILIRYQEHSVGARAFDPSLRQAAREVFQKGSHIVVGSPIANQHSEEVTCEAFGASPYSPEERSKFPYAFVWHSSQSIRSSFGWQGLGNEFGIVSTATGKMVARRTLVRDGEGEDCALILTQRIWQPRVRREQGPADDERIVIALLGYSGAGTAAAARTATDDRFAAALYPRQAGVPCMHVVSARYTSTPVQPPRDTREVTHWELVEEPASPARDDARKRRGPQPSPRKDGGEAAPRRKRRRGGR